MICLEAVLALGQLGCVKLLVLKKWRPNAKTFKRIPKTPNDLIVYRP